MTRYLNFIAATLFCGVMYTMPLAAQSLENAEKLDQLFSDLALPEQPGWEGIEETIWIEWSRTGSPAMDLLLKRGRDAMSEQDYAGAVEHFTALTDHAPTFAEGFNARASAYFHQGLYGPAIEDIRLALRYNPQHFAALSGLGIIFEELRMEKEALEAYRAAAKIHPHRPNVNDSIERLEKKLVGSRI